MNWHFPWKLSSFKGFKCIQKVCDKEECGDDKDCPPGQACLNGFCGSQCSTSEVEFTILQEIL